MDSILQGLHELAGVHGTIVFDSPGQILYQRCHAIYDLPTLTSVVEALVKAIDSIQLQHEDWDSISAQYSDGRLMVRKLGPMAKGSGRIAMLGILADGSLNQSFATVALRVAVSKLKKELDAGTLDRSAGAHPQPEAAATSTPAMASSLPAPLVRSELSSSGLVWSAFGSSMMSASSVMVADEASRTFLNQCTKALAHSVGPMSKVFVKEGVRKVSPNAPFSMLQAKALITDLESHIEDLGERFTFRTRLGPFETTGA
jgi:hypothetical protein